MVDIPETRYTRAPDGAHLAYQVFGEGPIDLVALPGGFTHAELRWEEPTVARSYRRLASFARVVCPDPRGVGLSNRDLPIPPIQEQGDDVAAVMDAAGMERAAVVGTLNGGLLGLAFAGTHPDRVTALVLQSTGPVGLARHDCPGPPQAIIDFLVDCGRRFDFRTMLEATIADSLGDERVIAWWERLARNAIGPDGLVSLAQAMAASDVRPMLPNITAPTVILHHEEETIFPLASAEALAGMISDATLKVLPGLGLGTFQMNAAMWLEEAEILLTGRRAQRMERRLATVLFTDIVDSTQQASELGDAAWRVVLEAHDQLARRTVTEFDGRLVKSTGDGVLALFDSPAAAVACASSLMAGAAPVGVQLRAGAHTGEVEVIGDDVGGVAVHIAARVAAKAGGGELLVSRTVRDLMIGSGVAFSGRGEHSLKGVPEAWQLYAVGG